MIAPQRPTPFLIRNAVLVIAGFLIALAVVYGASLHEPRDAAIFIAFVLGILWLILRR